MSKTERELLKEKADLLGVEYAGNISTDKLRALVNEANGEPVEEVVAEEEKVVDTKAPKEVKPRKLTDDEAVQFAIAKQRKDMMKLKRVIISCNDPQMKDWDTTPYLSISNSILTLPKMVVPLNVEWHIPMAYYDMLKGQKCWISVKGRDEKGRAITKRKQIARYNIQDLPDLTQEELDELKKAQITRDGVAKAE